MLSEYFKAKTALKKFDNDLLWSLGEIKDKKIIFYGAGDEFAELNKKYQFDKSLNIVAIADKKFENSGVSELNGIKVISPTKINETDYDCIMVTYENPTDALDYIFSNLDVTNKDVRTIFNEDVKNERENFYYLQKYNFNKEFLKLHARLRGKSAVIYGAGTFMQTIRMFYDLSVLNISAIADKKFENHAENETFYGYKVCSPDEIKNYKPDYVLVATKEYISIIEELYYKTLKGVKVRIRPSIRKPLLTVIKEIWNI